MAGLSIEPPFFKRTWDFEFLSPESAKQLALDTNLIHLALDPELPVLNSSWYFGLNPRFALFFSPRIPATGVFNIDYGFKLSIWVIYPIFLGIWSPTKLSWTALDSEILFMADFWSFSIEFLFYFEKG